MCANVILTLNFFLLLTLSHVHSLQFSMAGPKNSDTYGPYLLGFKHLSACPNSENNFANISVELVCEHNVFKGTITVTVPQAIRIVEMKVVIHTMKNNHKNLVWDYTIEKLCLNRLVSGVLKSHVDIRTCVLRKGTHTISMNFSDSVYLFFGSSFFYGEYISKFTVISTRKQVILCINADQIFMKKTALTSVCA